MFEKGDRVEVTGLPGAAGPIYGFDEKDEIFIGLTGEVVNVRERLGTTICQVKLDDGGTWWWESTSLGYTDIPNEDLPLEAL